MFPIVKYVPPRNSSINLIETLPNEILLKIISSLSPQEVITNCKKINRHFYGLASDPSLWKHLLKLHFPHSYSGYHSQPFVTISYLRQRLITTALNIGEGECRSQSYTGQGYFPIKSLATTKDYVCTATGMAVVNIWRHNRPKKVFSQLRDPISQIHNIQTQGDLLYTSSPQSTEVKVWNLDSLRQLAAWPCDEKTILDLQINEKAFYTSHKNGAIKAWDHTTGQLLNKFKQPENTLISFHVDQNCLYSSSTDKTIKMWDFRNRQPVTVVFHTDDIEQLCVVNNYLCYSDLKNPRVNICDLAKRDLRPIKMARRTASITAILGHDQYLYVASRDQTIGIWDLNSKNIVQLFSTYGIVTSLANQGGCLYAGGWNGNLMSYDFSYNKRRFIQEV